jgi:hypothetical protein
MRPHAAHHNISPATSECRDACIACAQICTEMLYGHCLEVGGAHARAEHVRAMADCAAICATAAGFMSRGSPQHHVICRACATVCRVCADSCRQLDGMEACAAACERCEASCRAMAQPVG